MDEVWDQYARILVHNELTIVKRKGMANSE
jgi:hypothetical protein